MKNIGTIIKEKRLNLGLSQSQLAQLLGYKSRSTINKIEKGINTLPLSKVKQISEILNIDAELFVGTSSTVSDDNELLNELSELVKDMDRSELLNLLSFAKKLSSNKR